MVFSKTFGHVGRAWVLSPLKMSASRMVTHDGRKLGSLGWMSNFSFYYAHHMSTIEGGMICTDDTAVYEGYILRSHGMVRDRNECPKRCG